MVERFQDISDLQDQLDALERDAQLLVEDLSNEQGRWRIREGSWSVAENLEHLAITNLVYLEAMKAPAIRARAAGRLRRRPARPGLVGRWFASKMEPPVRAVLRMKAPQKTKPGPSHTLADAFAHFLASQDEIKNYLRTNADLDLAGILFPNPFIPAIQFSLATGIHVLTAHERRHIWQAWRVRRAALALAGDFVRLAP